MSYLGLPKQTVSDDEIPHNVIGYISVQAPDSVFGGKVRTLNKSAGAYHASKASRDSVRRDLEKSGFKIIAGEPVGTVRKRARRRL